MVMKKTVHIGVTGLNNIDSPGPGIAVIRALRESQHYDVRIIGLSYESMEPGIYMPGMADKVYQIPYPTAGTEALLQRIEYIHQEEKLDLIIPNFDAELYNFIKISDRLEQLGIATFLPTLEQLEARDKINLFQFGVKHGLDVPRDRTIHQIFEIPNVAAEFSYPIVVKGKYYEAFVCYNYEQSEKAFHKLYAKWGLPIIIQEFVKGTEVNVAALGDGQGTAISIIPMRKMYITDKGKAWAGITIEDESLNDLAKKFVAVTKWKGGFELEVMKSPDGKLYIMEVNPRFPAWIYLSAGAGQNQPEALMQMALGSTVAPMTKYKVGKLFLRYAWDLIIDVEQFQQIAAYGEL
jgi:carbamoyl-phosphate synthase large subunit